MEKGRIQVYAKECIKLCKSNRYRVEFSNTQLEFKNTFNVWTNNQNQAKEKFVE